MDSQELEQRVDTQMKLGCSELPAEDEKQIKTKPGFIENPEHSKEKKDLRNIKKTIDFYKQFNSMTSNWCPANWVLIRKSLNSGDFYDRKIHSALTFLDSLFDSRETIFC